jgi:hypothetical protein
MCRQDDANRLGTMELPDDADFHPFECVRLTRVRDEEGELTDQVEIEGLHQGGTQDLRIGSSLRHAYASSGSTITFVSYRS